MARGAPQREESRRSREWLACYIAQTGEQPTAQQAAEWMGVVRDTAAHHLGVLAAHGRLVAYIAARPTGRPATVYRLPWQDQRYPSWVPLSDRVVASIAGRGAATARDIAEDVGVTARAVYTALRELRDGGVVSWSAGGVAELVAIVEMEAAW